MNLRLTGAGRAAIADGGNVGTAQVRFTHFAIGDGQGQGGAADDARAALRTERHRAAITGADDDAGRIAFRADFNPDAGYDITEAGVFGRAGDPAGPLTLYAYWTNAGEVAARTASGVDLVVAAVIEFARAAGNVAVTVGATITVGADVNEATDAAFGTTRYAADAEAGAGTARNRAMTPASTRAAAGKTVGSLVPGGPDDGTVYQLKGAAGGRVVAEPRAQDPATAARLGAITAAVTALGGRVTTLEGAALDLSGVVAGKRYMLEGVVGGGVRLVLSTLLMLRSVATPSIVPVEVWNSDYDPHDPTYTLDYRSSAGRRGSGSGIALTEGDWIIAGGIASSSFPPNAGDPARGWQAGVRVSSAVQVLRQSRVPSGSTVALGASRDFGIAAIRVPSGGTKAMGTLSPLNTGRPTDSTDKANGYTTGAPVEYPRDVWVAAVKIERDT